MRTLVLANVINIILDPCFIYGWGPFPELGVTGAAVATNIGRGCGVFYGFYYLFASDNRIQIDWNRVAIKLDVLMSILRISFGGIAQMLIATASWVFLMRIVSEFGDGAVAGYTIAVRIILFVILPAFGLSNAAATLVGQNLGAKLPDRAEATVWKIMQYVSTYMIATAIIVFAFDRALMEFFSAEEEVMLYGSACLRIFSIGLVFFGINGTAVQAFNGAGDTMDANLDQLLLFLDCASAPCVCARTLAGYRSLRRVLGGVCFRYARWYSRAHHVSTWSLEDTRCLVRLPFNYQC